MHKQNWKIESQRIHFKYRCSFSLSLSLSVLRSFFMRTASFFRQIGCFHIEFVVVAVVGDGSDVECVCFHAVQCIECKYYHHMHIVPDPIPPYPHTLYFSFFKSHFWFNPHFNWMCWCIRNEANVMLYTTISFWWMKR